MVNSDSLTYFEKNIETRQFKNVIFLYQIEQTSSTIFLPRFVKTSSTFFEGTIIMLKFAEEYNFAKHVGRDVFLVLCKSSCDALYFY